MRPITKISAEQVAPLIEFMRGVRQPGDDIYMERNDITGDLSVQLHGGAEITITRAGTVDVVE